MNIHGEIVLNKSIIIIAETFDGRLSPSTFELVECAKAIESMIAAAIHVIITDRCHPWVAEEFALETGLEVKLMEPPQQSSDCTEMIKQVLSPILSELSPQIICTSHSSRGLEIAGSLSVHLGACCVAGVEAVRMEQGRLIFSRPLFGARLVAHEYLKKTPTVVTIQPGSFSYARSQAVSPGHVEYIHFSGGPGRLRSSGIIAPSSDSTALSHARVVVAAGKGIGGKENMGMIEELAGCFPGSAVAGSRIACDLGWLDHGKQVGVTGATVSPLLYIACGISGSSQHMAGMKGSSHIVAINKDPNAPICQIADVCVIDDLCAFIPVLTDRLKCLP